MAEGKWRLTDDEWSAESHPAPLQELESRGQKSNVREVGVCIISTEDVPLGRGSLN